MQHMKISWVADKECPPVPGIRAGLQGYIEYQDIPAHDVPAAEPVWIKRRKD